MGDQVLEINGFKVEEKPSFKKNCKPFQEDAFHMGTHLGSNVMAMMTNHREKQMHYLILVDIPTGKRIKIQFPSS